MQVLSKSSKQTKKVSKIFAKELIKTKPGKGAFVVALQGNLGAGKTTFTQGFLRGLGVKSKITSPTFVILKSYILNYKPYNRAYHLDAYRIKLMKEIIDLNWKEMISNPKNIILIEWPERISKIIPKNSIKIKFEYGKKETERTLQIK
ncbi:tRNA (adenosine(37)-N6)-threonylcarbamoyltransferase complex ATPase subunit type 1 TsaE [Candidatus Wolfebacteria bacterium CG10_big_fil_rev_8_21_14_0_10_31_9]|uniref:tRNA threonylcarbamoyladenosine biosynthesis protein TsaE n=1 Tax=Candidatus Wolfebacteria bacterium CG10_big_fil_rev_8_21_14_0_10_31_9 TaxID=1975070 RepID=A0A2H0RBY8_9BACT|nr:MAG: tRNA (adenosine(37)-N6)-threonylcarbamoyltransferase complex ATPase subunit type 1 TsaE [Candidatus Wolfebacteria bacterium CG10_big_fil_rev_8_21_14_0_10_31_9]